ncbi:unnamed protein product, partial [Adineta ricciae]
MDTQDLAESNDNSVSAETFVFILLGNTGVGKSFLANILLCDDVFEHECSPSSVTHATEFRTFTFKGKTFIIFNIPGLIEDNQEAV